MSRRAGQAACPSAPAHATASSIACDRRRDVSDQSAEMSRAPGETAEARDAAAVRDTSSGARSSSNTIGGLRQLVVLVPARMQLADHVRSQRPSISIVALRPGCSAGCCAGVEPRGFGSNDSTVALDVEEVDVARGVQPHCSSSSGRRPGRRRACGWPSRRPATGRRRCARVAQIHAADLEHAHASALRFRLYFSTLTRLPSNGCASPPSALAIGLRTRDRIGVAGEVALPVARRRS